MKPRIEKKLSKRLFQLAPKLFSDAWIDNECDPRTKHFKHQNNGTLTPRQIRENWQQRVSVNHIPSIGGELDYWGEGTDWYTLWSWWKSNWEWHGDFEPYPDDHRFCGLPNVEGFRPTTRNLLRIAADCEAKEIARC